MQCLNCDNEAKGRSKYCSGKCKTAHNRHKGNVPVSGYVYLIHCLGFPYYKIGLTTGIPANRLKTLQASLPFELDLIKTFKTEDVYKSERELHIEFDLCHVRREWFMFSEDKLSCVLEKFAEMEVVYV